MSSKFRSALIRNKENKTPPKNADDVFDNAIQESKVQVETQEIQEEPETVQVPVTRKPMPTPQTQVVNTRTLDYMTSTELFIIYNLLQNFIDTNGMDENITSDYNRVLKKIKIGLSERLK